jgi:hypothetical protein
MHTFSNIADELISIEKSINKDCSTTRCQDANSCVVKAIAVAGNIDFVTADLLCREHFNRKFRQGVSTLKIQKGIEKLFDDLGQKVIGYWSHLFFLSYGLTVSDTFIVNPMSHIPILQLNFYRRKHMTLEQVRRQSKNRCFFVLIKGHALIIKNEKIIDYVESKRRRVFRVYEIN